MKNPRRHRFKPDRRYGFAVVSTGNMPRIEWSWVQLLPVVEASFFLIVLNDATSSPRTVGL